MASPAHVPALHTLSDRELIAETHRLAERERHATAHVIAALMELDARRLYLAEGCSSLFTYSTPVLHFSEHAAYGRIEAARAARRFPVILDLLAEGSITLTAVGLLAAHLTPENHAGLLAAVRHRSKREVERLVAEVRPLQAVPSSVRSLVRKLPAERLTRVESVDAADLTRSDGEAGEVAGSGPGAGGGAGAHKMVGGPSVPASTTLTGGVSAMSPVASDPICRRTPPGRPAVVAPLAPERYKVQVTISREAHDKLRRAQDLLRHAIPSGDPGAIFERALTVLVEDLERKTQAAVKRPRSAGTATPGSRHVPAAVKREVWARDEGRCAFIGTAGRCAERGFLELHHVVPFAEGGATDVANLQLRCRAHNAYEAEEWFGPLIVKEATAAYGNSVRTELLVSCGARQTTQLSSGPNRPGTRQSAAGKSHQAATDAMPSG